MFSDNLKTARKSKGFTQEEFAMRLNVVRQTVSKWEKGLSIPDAEMLIKIAEILEMPVSNLLGSNIEIEPDKDNIAEQLSRINEQLAIKNHRFKLTLKIIIWIVAAILVMQILIIGLSMIFGAVSYRNTTSETQSIELIEDSDKNTND